MVFDIITNFIRCGIAVSLLYLLHSIILSESQQMAIEYNSTIATLGSRDSHYDTIDGKVSQMGSI